MHAYVGFHCIHAHNTHIIIEHNIQGEKYICVCGLTNNTDDGVSCIALLVMNIHNIEYILQIW